MRFKNFIALYALLALAAAADAQNISGTILIKRKLTKRSVTPTVSAYQLGTAVKLGKDAEQDPLAFEKSRVVIYLEGAAPANAAPAGETLQQVEQIDRRFSPNLVVVPAGSTVSFPNMDPIFHNIYSLSKTKAFDLGAYDKGETRRVQFPKPGIVDVYCHLHPNMAATIVVTPNRWYAQSDGAGQYNIPDVPPGHYTVVAWHKTAGFLRKPITVEAGHDAVADFLIPIDDDGKPEAEAKVIGSVGSR